MNFSYQEYCTGIFTIRNRNDFCDAARQAYSYQCENNAHFAEMKRHLAKIPDGQFHFLPLEFFKHHSILSTAQLPEMVFRSSGTGGLRSQHWLTDVSLYRKSSLAGFEYFYGDVSKFALLALLPDYIERGDASLVFMMEHLIKTGGNPLSGFYLRNYQQLTEVILQLEKSGQKYLLLGISSALIEFSHFLNTPLKNAIVMETGGAKGMQREWIRAELHDYLKFHLGLSEVHSEYGMTELLSQAYSSGNGIFRCPPWMKVLVRDTNDPLDIATEGTGALNIIDLANINSCCFIETSDLGRVYPDGSFEVFGRFDHGDVRGCNQMM